MTTVNKNNAQLKAHLVGKAAKVFNKDMLVLDFIESRSAPAIAGMLIDNMVKKGNVVQYIPTYLDQNGEEREHNFYKFSHKTRYLDYDFRQVALFATCLSRILPHMDEEFEYEALCSNTYIWKNSFRDVWHANKSKNIYNPKEDVKENWVKVVKHTIDSAIDCNLIETRTDENGLVMLKHTQKYLGSAVSRKGIMHQDTPITDANRRKERVKGNYNLKKDGTSSLVREAMSFIEDQAQVVNEYVVGIAAKLLQVYKGEEGDGIIPEILKDSEHVIHGSLAQVGKKLYSELFADLRGRMYQFAHSGPNPQSADLAKVMCLVENDNWVEKGSREYDIFMDEFTNEICGKKNAKYMDEKFIRYAAANPEKAFHALLEEEEYTNKAGELKTRLKMKFKKIFSYLQFCRYWLDFETNGKANVRIGFGPDAKCSGAQYLGIVAGCRAMMEACGLTTGEKGDDPYIMSATEVAKIMAEHNTFSEYTPLSRDEIKTPFMAIQYGGGVPALMKKDFVEIMNKKGVPSHLMEEYCKLVIEGIQKSMGEIINGWINGLRTAIEKRLDETGKCSLRFRMLDGFTFTKKGEAYVHLTEQPFRITLPEINRSVIFGSFEQEEGWMVASKVEGTLQKRNFIYYSPVHFIQGLDAVVARRIALEAKWLGIEGYTSIHDQMRSQINDTHLMMEVVARAYEWTFITNDPAKHLEDQLGHEIVNKNCPLKEKATLDRDVLRHENAYYFE